MSPLATHMRSGATPSCSQANIVPVRPKPVATSSQMRKSAELVAQLAHGAQVAVGVHVDARRALHQRLDDDRRAALGVLGQQRAQRVGVAGRRLPGVEQQRAVERVEELDAADRDRAERVAVVAVAQADEARAPPLAALVVELVGHLQRDLARRSSRCRRRRRGCRPSGARSTRRLASLAAGACERPSMVECATRSSWSLIAMSIAGWRWPCTLHHSDETPSM